ncbi:MAG: cobalamin biosynthesis protein [Gammaproteobacteria bacterium]|nr:cobalamin biosynthesis protein [Gammaproteobacteria bacterium]
MNRVALGIGCDRDTSLATLETAVAQALALASVSMDEVQAVASIDKKQDEVCLLALAKQHGWRLKFYSAEALAQVPVPNPSATVMHYMGTPTVAEAAALLAANTDMQNLLVEKHKYRGPDNKNATVSIAKVTKS